MKKKTKLLMFLLVCVMIIGSALNVYAADCCHNPNVVTRYEAANPGTWIIDYCSTCGSIYSRRWTHYEINSVITPAY